MARRFVRVDLSDLARDFRPVAVEPGVPLLDRSNANARILLKWLGGLSAEPEWEGESVNFYVRDDHGGRLEEVACSPASDDDLQGALKADLDALRERIARAKPENSTERGVHKALLQEFAKLVDAEHRADRDNYFFRYKDVNGRWRLVWCWGYQRVDQQPATTLVCGDPKCTLLFVRRPGQTAKCPSCSALQVLVPARRTPRKRRLLLGLLLILFGALLMYAILNQARLTVAPDRWAGPVGSRVDYVVRKPGLFGIGGEDVTRHAVAVSGDPRVVRIDRYGLAALANSPGKTLVRFDLGDRTTTATMTVGPAKNPDKLTIEPSTVELGVGTTAHLRLIGDYGGGVRVDLTDSAYWIPNRDGVVFAHNGLVEGLVAGKTQVAARYQATPESKPLETAAQVTVAKVDFTGLEMAIDPLPVPLGQASRLQVSGLSKTGQKYSLLQSSRLKLKLDPPAVASLYGQYLEGRKAGRGKIAVAWNGTLAADMSFDVAPVAGVDRLIVSPEGLDLVVGEIADLDMVSPSTDPIRLASSDPAVAEVTRSNRIVGRAAGKATVTVAQGDEKRTVAVNVAKARIEAIAVKPVQMIVPVTKEAAVRVVGRIAGGREVELAPDLLKVEKKPARRYASLDAKSLKLSGVRPTEKDAPQPLALRFEALRAEGGVEVVLPPGVKLPGELAELRITSDQGPAVRFPVGAEFDDFRVEAKYPDGMTRVVTRQATMRADGSPAESPVAFARGRIIGVRPGKSVVHAEYDGMSSDEGLEVEVTADVQLDELRLRPAPVSVLPGETVPLEAVGRNGGKSIGVLNRLGDLAWKSDNPQVAHVSGPAVTGLKLGQGKVTAALGPVTSEPATVNVVDAIADALVLDRDALVMRVGESRQIGADLAVSRGDADLSRQATVQSSKPDVVRYDPDAHALVAVAPGAAAVTFTAGDKLATATVEVLPAAPLEGTVLVEPASGLLAPGQALDLRAYVINPKGDRIDVTNLSDFSSSVADAVEMRGNRACALAPGSAEITAKVRDSELSGSAQVAVNNESITDLMADPSRLDMAVGDLAQLRLLGRAASGTYELFPRQPRLKMAVGGPNPEVIEVPASDQVQCVSALATGNAEIAVTWDDRLNARVPVAVGASNAAITDLRIEPYEATIHPGQVIAYQVTGVRNGGRQLLSPADGVTLSAANPAVAAIDGVNVQGASPGTTGLVARVGDQEAAARLSVVEGDGSAEVATRYPGSGVVVTDGDGRLVDDFVHVDGSGGVRYYDDGFWHGGSGYRGPGAAESLVRRVEPGSDRFLDVRATTSEQIVPDFTVQLDVTASPTERPLEYRAYRSGDSPPETWTPAQPQGDRQRTTLDVGPIETGPRSTWYDLRIEARDPSDASVHQLPIRLQFRQEMEVNADDARAEKPAAVEGPAVEMKETQPAVPQNAEETTEKVPGPFDEN